MTQRKLGNLFIAGENGSVVDLTGRHAIANTGIVTNNIAEYYWDSAYQPGSSDYRLVIQDSPDFDLISPSVETATIDFWLQDITTNYGTVMAQHESLSKHWSFRKLQGSNVMFRPAWGINLIGTNIPLDFEWHHHALVKQGNVYKLYSDGVLQSSATYATENLPNAPFSVFDHWYDYGPTNQKLANIRFSSEALWTSNFSIDPVSLRYESTHIPTSEIYHVGSRGNLRGKAKQGWIRPTVKQFFTSTDYLPIDKSQLIKLISGNVGNIISDMNNTAPANSFDGSRLTYTWEHFGGIMGVNHYVGKDWGSGVTKSIKKVIVKSPENYGFSWGTSSLTTMQVSIQGSTDGTNWITLVASDSFTKAAFPTEPTNGTPMILTFDTIVDNNYRYHRVLLYANGPTGFAGGFGEIEFYENNY